VDAGAKLQALPYSSYPLNGGGYTSWLIAKKDTADSSSKCNTTFSYMVQQWENNTIT
jgi:hypothetical protein